MLKKTKQKKFVKLTHEPQSIPVQGFFSIPPTTGNSLPPPRQTPAWGLAFPQTTTCWGSASELQGARYMWDQPWDTWLGPVGTVPRLAATKFWPQIELPFDQPPAHAPTHLSYSLVLRQVPMGHKKTIILVLVISYFIIIILKKKKKSTFTCGNNTCFIKNLNL